MGCILGNLSRPGPIASAPTGPSLGYPCWPRRPERLSYPSLRIGCHIKWVASLLTEATLVGRDINLPLLSRPAHYRAGVPPSTHPGSFSLGGSFCATPGDSIHRDAEKAG